MWEMSVSNTNSFAVVHSRFWFDTEEDARPYYEKIVAGVKGGWSKNKASIEIKSIKCIGTIRVDEVQSVHLTDLEAGLEGRYTEWITTIQAEAAKGVLDKFGKEVADIWAQIK